MPMKLALIRARYNPFGGAERFLNEAVQALLNSSLDVAPVLFTRAWPDQPGTQLQHRIVNPRYFTSNGRDRGFAEAVSVALKSESFDLVQSYERIAGCDIYHAVDGVHAEWLRRRQRIQNRFQRIGVAINPRHSHVLLAEQAMFTAPRFRAAICISQMVKQDILRHADIDPAKLHVIYSGVDTGKFTPELAATLREPTRSKLGIPPDAPVALFVGSGFERKGLDAFIRMLAAKPVAAQQVYGIVVGSDKRLRDYQHLASRLGVAKRLFFTGGVSDTRPYYAASDAFVLPTIYEPFGLVCLEALACGLPVITTDAAGAAELIRDGENGFVVDALDRDALQQSLLSALASPGMKLAARETALGFSPQGMTEKYVALYRQLLEKSSAIN